MSEVVAAQLEARFAGVAADVRAAFDGWVRTRRRLDIELTMKLGAFSGELAAAKRRFVAALGEGPPRDRAEAWRRFDWVRDFDRERRRVEEEVWALVARARADERAFRAVLSREAGELERAPALVAGALRNTVAGMSEAGQRVSETAFGRQLEAQRRSQLADARAAIDSELARVEQRLAIVLARTTIDWDEVSARFEATVAERLAEPGGASLAPAAGRAPLPRRRAPSAPPAVKRKRARVPKFLLGGFYQKGSMRRSGDAIELTFINPLAFCVVQNGDPVSIDGRAHPTERTTLDNGDKRLVGTQLSPDNYLKYAKGAALKLTLAECTLGPGPHRISLSLELRKLGWIELNITDEVQ